MTRREVHLQMSIWSAKIQKFLDENPKIQIKHVQFTTVAIVPKTASWDTTNADIDWEMEKSVLILFEG